MIYKFWILDERVIGILLVVSYLASSCGVVVGDMDVERSQDTEDTPSICYTI